MRNLALAVLLLVSFASVAGAGTQKVTLDVKGMHCGTCPLTVKMVLKREAGVTDVRVLGDKASADVTFDASKVSPQHLAKVVTEAGYPATVRGAQEPPK